MSEARQPVIVGGARTPIGRLLGSLASKSASDLGGVSIAGALDRAGIQPDQVEYVIMGQVLQAGTGQITARQAAVAAGIGMSVPALTINKVCLSGLDAIALAAQLIRGGEYDVIVAGGMESMTRAPHLLPNSRSGYKYGSVEVLDSMAIDGLTDAFDHLSMGESTENSGRELGITRAEQDEFAAVSHQRAAAATKSGLLAAEIVGVTVPQRGGEPLIVTQDEGGHDRGVAGQAAAGLRQGRHDHRRERVADLRRRRRRGGDVGGSGRPGGRVRAGRDRREWQRRGPGQLTALPAVQRDKARPEKGRAGP
jgi:acetyl-CoA C-acetyltransferase